MFTLQQLSDQIVQVSVDLNTIKHKLAQMPACPNKVIDLNLTRAKLSAQKRSLQAAQDQMLQNAQ